MNPANQETELMTEQAVQWILASQNAHKAEEITALLKGAPIDLQMLPEGFQMPPEIGHTLRANAQMKARAVARRTGQLALADDTGLEVDALGGEPGVYSARYAGEGATFASNCTKLLDRLIGVHGLNRRARFRCILVLTHPDGQEITAEGRVEGFITDEPRGEGGFGYDPVFVPEGDERTLAEMTADEKNSLSHRARAIQNLRENLERLGRWTP